MLPSAQGERRQTRTSATRRGPPCRGQHCTTAVPRTTPANERPNGEVSRTARLVHARGASVGAMTAPPQSLAPPQPSRGSPARRRGRSGASATPPRSPALNPPTAAHRRGVEADQVPAHRRTPRHAITQQRHTGNAELTVRQQCGHSFKPNDCPTARVRPHSCGAARLPPPANVTRLGWRSLAAARHSPADSCLSESAHLHAVRTK